MCHVTPASLIQLSLSGVCTLLAYTIRDITYATADWAGKLPGRQATTPSRELSIHTIHTVFCCPTYFVVVMDAAFNTYEHTHTPHHTTLTALSQHSLTRTDDRTARHTHTQTRALAALVLVPPYRRRMPAVHKIQWHHQAIHAAAMPFLSESLKWTRRSCAR